MSQKQFEQPIQSEEMRKPNFVDFLCSCPAEEGDLDLSRDPDDGSNREEAFAYHEKLLQARQCPRWQSMCR